MRLHSGFRTANRWSFGDFNLRKEAVPATCDRFHKTRTVGGIAESVADFVDRFVEPVIEIHERVCRPEFLLEFLAGYDFAGVLKERRQHLERLFLKANTEAVFAQFAGAEIQLENPETEPVAKLMVFWHGQATSVGRGSLPPDPSLRKQRRG
ncbi:MAG TPA: hypothetical protein VOA78_06080 [Candidatus Dormibacteraeota bacterium]|nr:hypothetical protein [Candidatus Dormibacteraeota bacterium]